VRPRPSRTNPARAFAIAIPRCSDDQTRTLPVVAASRPNCSFLLQSSPATKARKPTGAIARTGAGAAVGAGEGTGAAGSGAAAGAADAVPACQVTLLSLASTAEGSEVVRQLLVKQTRGHRRVVCFAGDEHTRVKLALLRANAAACAASWRTAGAPNPAFDGHAGGAAAALDRRGGDAAASDAEAPLVAASGPDGTCSVAWLPGDGKRAEQLKLEVEAFLASYMESSWAPSSDVLQAALATLRRRSTLQERAKLQGLCHLASAKAPAVLLHCGAAPQVEAAAEQLSQEPQGTRLVRFPPRTRRLLARLLRRPPAYSWDYTRLRDPLAAHSGERVRITLPDVADAIQHVFRLRGTKEAVQGAVERGHQLLRRFSDSRTLRECRCPRRSRRT